MKIISSLLIIVSLYFAFGIIAIRYYIDDLVFMKVPQSETREFVRYSVLTRNAETLIRGYGGFNEGRCVIFFPGRSGGIPRYEIELFDGLVSKGIPVYALSYPGYEGASGESSFSNIMESTELAISLLVKEQHCNITKTVFVGRSLGASIAIKVAAEYKVKGLVLDSVGLSC